MAAVARRTFAAKQHPKGSAERARLNAHPVTSEYLPSYRYAVVLDDGSSYTSHRTKAEAEADLPAATTFEERRRPDGA